MANGITSRNSEVTIIGAGIGGLTAGLILKKKGYKVTLYESAPEIKPVGAGIAMANNAMQIFRKSGLSGQIEKAGHRISRMRVTDAKLNNLSVTDLSDYERKYGIANVAIHRGSLQHILAQKLGFEDIRLSKRLLKIETSANGYTLHFDDGAKSVSGPLIGADGIRSTVRAQLFGEGEIIFSGQKCWRGVCKIPFGERYTHEAIEAWGRGKRFGFVRIDDHRVYWYAVVNAAAETSPSTDLKKVFEDFHPDVSTMIGETDASQVYFSDINELKPLRTWGNQNACLIGDAAHAMTPNMGQGACQAIEDAYVLGELMGKTASIRETFERYHALRKGKVKDITNRSRLLGVVSQIENTAAIWFRNAAMKMMPDVIAKKQLESVFKLDQPV